MCSEIVDLEAEGLDPPSAPPSAEKPDKIKSSLKGVVEHHIRNVLQENERKQREFLYNFLQRIFFNFKMKEVRLSVYDNKNNINFRGEELPLFDVILGRT